MGLFFWFIAVITATRWNSSRCESSNLPWILKAFPPTLQGVLHVHWNSLVFLGSVFFLFCLILFNQSVFLWRHWKHSLPLKTFQPVVKSFAWGKRKVSAFILPDSLLKKRTFSSRYCMNDCVHLYSSPRCDGWIWAKDWSSVSRVCSRRQRIHREAGMLCSGKVSWHPWSAGICSLVALYVKANQTF